MLKSSSFFVSALTLAILSLLSACSSVSAKLSPLNQSPAYYDYLQPSFSEYVSVSREWLKNNRQFITEDHQKEINMNAPFSLSPEQKTERAILLVHGLGDSPFYYSDLAKSYQAQGFHVQVLLLPGHGSKPSDLMFPHYEDWQTIVDHYANLLKKEYSEVWLGGFSTGANLIGIHSIEQGGIAGLLFISPGFQSHVPFIEKLAPVAQLFTDWGWRAEEDNLARYSSSPFNASIAYSESASKIRDLLEDHSFNVPSFFIMTEADSVIDPDAIKDIFLEKVSHPHKSMLWYGETTHEHSLIHTRSMKLPEYRISSGSHMNPLFAPNNQYFGIEGEKRMCKNGITGEDKLHCLAGKPVWYSAWGYRDGDKIHARLTWNPYYQEMENELARFTQESERTSNR